MLFSDEEDSKLHIPIIEEIKLPNEDEYCVLPPLILKEDPLLESKSFNLSSTICKSESGVTNISSIKSESKVLEETFLNKKSTRIYSCSLCKYETSNRSTFRNHNLVHHSKKLYNCYHCLFKTKYRDYLKDHLRIHYGENGKCYQCDKCTFKTAIRTNLARHKHIHSNLKQHLCHICPFNCHDMKNLNRHIDLIHNKGVYFECNMCNYKTLFKYDFTQHEKSHDGKNLFKCPTCVYIGPSKGSLRTHMRSHSMHLIECHDCGYRTTSKPILINHIMIHRNEKPYKCFDCSYTARTITPFKAHLKKYNHEDGTKVTIFRCEVCNYETLRARELMWHQKVHTCKRLFECYICEYKTDSSSNFRKHEYIHEKNKIMNLL